MPATLRALLDRADLGLRLLTTAPDGPLGDARLDAPISWLHSSDLDDPTPFLTGGQALLTTGRQFGPAPEVDADAVAAYVRRLHDRGVVALGFGTEVVRAGTPDALVSACRAVGLPLFEVPYRTSFIAVAQANADTVAREANAAAARALDAQRAVSLAAMRPDGLGATLAELSRQLDAWVGLLDGSGRLDRGYPDDGVPAADLEVVQREAGRLLRAGQRASLPVTTEQHGFTLQTLGTGGRLSGVLAIGADDDLDPSRREVVTAVIALAGLALQQNRELGRARGLLRTGLLTLLGSGEADVVDRTSRELWGPLPPEPVRVAALDLAAVDADPVVDVLERWVQERPGRLFHALDDVLVVCVGADDTAPVEELIGQHGLHAGLSDPSDWASFARARAEAVQALARSREGAPRVLAFADVAREGVVFIATRDAAEVARTFLAPVVAHDAASGTRLVATLRAWLEHDCEVDRTARALGVHRHTVRARVEHAGRLLDRDLSRFATRADVWAALVALDPPA